jgi:hypothetical protein
MSDDFTKRRDAVAVAYAGNSTSRLIAIADFKAGTDWARAHTLGEVGTGVLAALMSAKRWQAERDALREQCEKLKSALERVQKIIPPEAWWPNNSETRVAQTAHEIVRILSAFAAWEAAQKGRAE